jgi:hypothetical protein
MMRALAIAAIVRLVAACAPEEDLCAGKPGVCISLRIDSAVTLDEIAIRADDRGERWTPKPPSVLTLPVRFAVILSGARSQRDLVHLDVDGLLGGEVRARSSADVHLDRTGRGEASLRLLPVGDGERDLAVAPVDADGRDLAPVDFAVAADLARASDLRGSISARSADAKCSRSVSTVAAAPSRSVRRLRRAAPIVGSSRSGAT